MGQQADIDTGNGEGVAGTATTATTVGNLEELVAAYRGVTLQIDDLTAVKKLLSAQIEQALKATGQATVDTPSGKVYYVEGRTSIRYDAARLDELCESSNWWKQMLEGFRTATPTAGYVAVKVNKK